MSRTRTAAVHLVRDIHVCWTAGDLVLVFLTFIPILSVWVLCLHAGLFTMCVQCQKRPEDGAGCPELELLSQVLGNQTRAALHVSALSN